MSQIVVFDSNLLISARLSPHGKPEACLALARHGSVASVTCLEILEEFRTRLIRKLNYDVKIAQDLADEVRAFSQLIKLPGSLHGIVTDPDDDKIIECAVVGNAAHIVTGDKKHLLPLGSYQGIHIVSPADFLALLGVIP